MRQKVALTAAHLLCTGLVADMGMGSGAQSDALAALYPMLEVVGVDLDATMVSLARERYRRTNLRFVEGDIAEPIFEAGTLDGIFECSSAPPTSAGRACAPFDEPPRTIRRPVARKKRCAWCSSRSTRCSA